MGQEFTNLIHNIEPTRCHDSIMDMYNHALDLTHGEHHHCTEGIGDSMSQDAFVYVAMQNHLPHPSHRANPVHAKRSVLCSVFERSWVQGLAFVCVGAVTCAGKERWGEEQRQTGG